MAHRVLTNPDLLRYISDYNTDTGNLFITESRNIALQRRVSELVFTDTSYYICVQANNIQAIIILADNHITRGVEKGISEAAETGNVDALDVFNQKQLIRFTKSMIYPAAEYCQIAVLEWIWKNSPDTYTDLEIVRAYRFSHHEVIRYMYDKNIRHNYAKIIALAIDKNDIPAVKFIMDKIDNTAGKFCDKCDEDCAEIDPQLVLNFAISMNDIDFAESLYNKYSNQHFLEISFVGVSMRNITLATAMWVTEHHNATRGRYTIRDIAVTGKLDVLKWIYNNSLPEEYDNFEYILDYIASTGNLEIMEWVHENLKSYEQNFEIPLASSDAMEYAAYHNYSDIMKWLHLNRAEGCTVSAICYAAGNGNIEMVEWLYANYKKDCSGWFADDAIKNNHFEVVKLLHQKYSEDGSESHVNTMNVAAASGNISIMEWIHLNYPLNSYDDALYAATMRNEVAAVKWLIANTNAEWNAETAMLAVEFNEYDLLVSLRNSNVEKFKSAKKGILIKAAQYGRLKMLELIYKDYNLFYDFIKIMNIAAAYGHLHILKWLRKIKLCVPDASTVKRAIEAGSLDIVKWLYYNYPNDVAGSTNDCIGAAISNNNLYIAKWLYQRSRTYVIDDTVKLSKCIPCIMSWLRTILPNSGILDELIHSYKINKKTNKEDDDGFY